jgi:hypothetical protein
MRKSIHYLQSISISFGLLVILKSAYGLIKSILILKDPFKSEFWDFYVNSTRLFSSNFMLLWFIGMIISFAFLYFYRNKLNT